MRISFAAPARVASNVARVSQKVGGHPQQLYAFLCDRFQGPAPRFASSGAHDGESDNRTSIRDRGDKPRNFRRSCGGFHLSVL